MIVSFWFVHNRLIGQRTFAGSVQCPFDGNQRNGIKYVKYRVPHPLNKWLLANSLPDSCHIYFTSRRFLRFYSRKILLKYFQTNNNTQCTMHEKCASRNWNGLSILLNFLSKITVPITITKEFRLMSKAIYWNSLPTPIFTSHTVEIVPSSYQCLQFNYKSCFQRDPVVLFGKSLHIISSQYFFWQC